MARIRSLKPEFWLDRKLARRLSRDERMLYIGLWNQADEHARALGDPNVVKGQVFPYDADLTVDVIDRMLDRLDAAGVVQRYEVDEDPFLYLPKLGDHQRLEPAKSRSRLPEPPSRVTSVTESGSATLPHVTQVTESENRADSSASGADPAQIFSESPILPSEIVVDLGKQADQDPAQIFSDESARGADESEKKNASLCSREHVASKRTPLPPTGSEVAVREPDRPKRGGGGAVEVARRLNATARSVEADRIAAAYSASLDVPMEAGLRVELAVALDKCLKSRIPLHAIAAGIRAWDKSDSWSPSQVPKFVHKAGRAAAESTRGVAKPTTQALSAQQVADQLIAEMGLE